ncbi:hypothetical protein C1T17_02385 [Sphingobium sp. SCG-1]|nr:hypothetical protein C1T17_02385 [Sphingobium sp. SCG-1]
MRLAAAASRSAVIPPPASAAHPAGIIDFEAALSRQLYVGGLAGLWPYDPTAVDIKHLPMDRLLNQ